MQTRRTESTDDAATSDTRDAGFTLVEVIVALAMLSIGLSVVLGLISGSLQQARTTERTAEAGSLAQSLLADVGASQPVQSGERDGKSPDGYRWHLRIQPYGSASEQEGLPVALYLVATEVEWDDGAQPRSFALKTLRLGPAAERR